MAVSAAAFNPNVRTFRVMLGDLPVYADATVIGRFRPAITQADPEYCHPEESPEVEVQSLTVGETDVTGLLDETVLWESVQEQILTQLADADREGDPDAYDKWRDSQMDKQS